MTSSDFTSAAFEPVILKAGLVEVHLIPYGLHLHRFLVHTKGVTSDLVVGPEDPKLYLKEGRSFRNTIIGRYANRLPVGQTKIKGLQVNPGANESIEVSLHGGPEGFDLREWTKTDRSVSKLFGKKDDVFPAAQQEVIFRLTSSNGDQGFPSTLYIEVLVQLKEDKVTFAYRAIVEEGDGCPINLTQHTGWTLNPFDGQGEEDISDHEIIVHASRAVELDQKTSLATGNIIDVKSASKPLDFTCKTSLAKFLKQGVDDNLIFDRPRSDSGKEVIHLSHPRAPVSLSFTSDQSSLMLYTAEHFALNDGSRKALHNPSNTKEGYPKHGCLFLEFHSPVGCCLHDNLIEANGGDETILLPSQTYEAWHTVAVQVK